MNNKRGLRLRLLFRTNCSTVVLDDESVNRRLRLRSVGGCIMVLRLYTAGFVGAQSAVGNITSVKKF